MKPTTQKKPKQFLYNSHKSKRTFDIFNNANPSDTIHIKYTSLEDVINTITMLEKLYKTHKYDHKRIFQVGMIMKVRLELLQDKKPEQYKLANKYFKFLKKRTKLNDIDRYKIVFKL